MGRQDEGAAGEWGVGGRQMTQGLCGWGGRWLDGQVGGLGGHTHLVQVHILGELLLQHVL